MWCQAGDLLHRITFRSEGSRLTRQTTGTKAPSLAMPASILSGSANRHATGRDAPNIGGHPNSRDPDRRRRSGRRAQRRRPRDWVGNSQPVRDAHRRLSPDGRWPARSPSTRPQPQSRQAGSFSSCTPPLCRRQPTAASGFSLNARCWRFCRSGNDRLIYQPAENADRLFSGACTLDGRPSPNRH